MAYVDSLLATGERIVRIERQHWFVLVYHARWGLLALLLGIVLGVLQAAGSLPSGLLGQLILVVTVLLLVGGGLAAVWAILRWQNEEFVVTSRRVIVVEGVVNKRTTDSSLEKINDAVLTQSIFGRIFGFGDLEVLTAAEAGIERLRMLVDANGFKKSMLDAKYEHERELAQQFEPAPVPSAPAAAPAAPSAASPAMTSDQVTATLARLADLRDRGAISPDEYEAKKRDLLARL